jgi:NAD(P)-dependent dehydrogenase (short-subunit alcohol dehydrogenase family)
MVTRALDAVLDRALLGYGNVGYRARSRGWAPVPRLDGKVVLVTGAKAGLGRAIAEGLVALGAGVRILVRGEAPDIGAAVDTLDVSSLAAVRAYAYDGPVHALIHNAGVMPSERTETAEGHELALATHVLGPHLLTRRLRPERVIWVSSGGMYTQKLRVDDLEYRVGEYNGTTAYARTKRMQVVLSELWARERFSASGHPGWVDTPGIAHSLPTFGRVTRPILRTVAQGADTFVWLAAADVPSGRFWHDRRPRPTHYLPFTRESEADRRALWDFVEASAAPA